MPSNTGKQAAVFHVYNRLDLTAIPRRYMVETGKQLDDVWNTINDKDLWELDQMVFTVGKRSAIKSS